MRSTTGAGGCRSMAARMSLSSRTSSRLSAVCSCASSCRRRIVCVWTGSRNWGNASTILVEKTSRYASTAARLRSADTPSAERASSSALRTRSTFPCWQNASAASTNDGRSATGRLITRPTSSGSTGWCFSMNSRSAAWSTPAQLLKVLGASVRLR